MKTNYIFLDGEKYSLLNSIFRGLTLAHEIHEHMYVTNNNECTEYRAIFYHGFPKIHSSLYFYIVEENLVILNSDKLSPLITRSKIFDLLVIGSALVIPVIWILGYCDVK